MKRLCQLECKLCLHLQAKPALQSHYLTMTDSMEKMHSAKLRLLMLQLKLMLERGRVSILALFCATVLSACAVGPDYQTPTTDAGQAFANAVQPEFSTQSVDVAWWKLFEDQELNQLVDQTVQHNRNLQAARANLREARALYLDAGLNMLPTVTSHANETQRRCLKQPVLRTA